MMVGGDRIAVSEVSAGNIAALTGIKSAAAGVTITRNKDDTGFGTNTSLLRTRRYSRCRATINERFTKIY